MIIFDEKEYAQSIEKKGFKTKNKRVYELNILIKYWIYLGLDESKVKEKAIKFCEKYIEDFNYDEWYKVINRTINSAYRRDLITGRVVNITENELNTIQQLENIHLQKLAFVMLVLYKFHNCNKFKVTLDDLFSLSEINHNSEYRLKFLHKLTKLKLIDIDDQGKRIVKFTDDDSEVKITIKKFDDFILHFYYFLGDKKIKWCEECSEVLIRITTANNNKYCKKCKRNKQLLHQRESMQKSRNNM
ncbi:hypothetical protein D7X33_22635 [Butyricicoccus sp. 1XD8-22]|nr:hypothetical protein D7X33_22635 [Butyricicoccus sp. 1XD8-22]